LTNEKNDKRATTATTVSQEAPTAAMEMLSAEEEHVVRMRHGLGEGDDYELKFGLGATDETMAKLANLEMFLVEKFAKKPVISGAFDGVFADVEAESVSVHATRRSDD